MSRASPDRSSRRASPDRPSGRSSPSRNQAAAKSPFFEQLRQRDNALRLELDTIQGQLVQIRLDRDSLGTKTRQLEQTEAFCEKTELDVWEREQQIGRLTVIKRSSRELEREIKLLTKTAVSLREQLAASQAALKNFRERRPPPYVRLSLEELSDMRLALEREEHEFRQQDLQWRESESLLEKAKVKATQVEALRAGVASLRDEVAEQNRQTRAREREASVYDAQVALASARRTGLVERQAAAEARKRELIASVPDRERKRSLVVEQREQMRQKRAEQERLAEELDQIEHELVRDEQQWSGDRQREDEAAAAVKRDIEAASRVVEKPKDRVTEFLDKYEEDTAAADLRVERAERISAQRKAMLELERARWSVLWKAKHEDADRRLRELELKVTRSQSVDLLNMKASDFERENAELAEQIASQEEELRQLEDAIRDQAEFLQRLRNEGDEERERIAQEERDLDQDELRQQIETTDLEAHVVDLKLRKGQLELRLRVAEARQTAAQRVLELSQEQLATAEQRATLLKLQGASGAD